MNDHVSLAEKARVPAMDGAETPQRRMSLAASIADAVAWLLGRCPTQIDAPPAERPTRRPLTRDQYEILCGSRNVTGITPAPQAKR